MIGPVKCKARTIKEYENTNVVYSCLIPKSSLIDVDVGDIIKACLNLCGIKNMEGVVKCHTSLTVRDTQRICILEVTELRSGDTETTEELMVTEESMPSVAPPNINVQRERLTSEVGSVGGSSVSKELADYMLGSPSKNIKSPAKSETDSVELTLGNFFLKKSGT